MLLIIVLIPKPFVSATNRQTRRAPTDVKRIIQAQNKRISKSGAK